MHGATALVRQHSIILYQRHLKWMQRVLVTCILLFRLDLLFSHAAPVWLRSVITFSWIWQCKFGGIWPGFYFFDLSTTNINGIVVFSVWSVPWVVCISQIIYIHANKERTILLLSRELKLWHMKLVFIWCVLSHFLLWHLSLFFHTCNNIT